MKPTTRRGERGAALLTAMIIVAMVATLAGSMIWQQWRSVQVEAAERARTQAAWILSGALDWARLILREDARTGGADSLGEPWAVPLAEARLSTFLAADRNNTDDGPEAFLSGSITDAQSRYNLRNLIKENQVVPEQLAVLQRLCEFIDVAPAVAVEIANGLRAAAQPMDQGAGSAAPPLMPQTLDQLRWLGIDPQALRRLRPYVELLPGNTLVNVNTAPREVIAAVIDRMDLAGAERLVQARQRSPFGGLEDVRKVVPEFEVSEKFVGVGSAFFEIRGRLRLQDRVLEERSLVERRGLEIVPLQRQRITSREPAGG